MTTPRILVSNDDGYASDGIRALVDAVTPLGEVWVVAPEAEQSAAAHAISIHRPLRLREVRPRWYAVDGTPTDCSWLGINHLMKDRRPELVVSGINHGANLADDVTYSGTVAAAMEASLIGVPAIAFSLAGARALRLHATPPASPRGSSRRRSAAAPLAGLDAAQRERPRRVSLRGYAVTRLGRHSYGSDVVEKTDPRGRKYYWIGGTEYQHEDIPGSDCNVVLRERRVSVTPLHMDLTDEATRKQVMKWTIEGFARARGADQPRVLWRFCALWIAFHRLFCSRARAGRRGRADGAAPSGASDGSRGARP